MAGLYKEVFIAQLMEGFYPNTSFLNYVTNMNEHVRNDAINLAEAGVDPAVLENNTAYPIPMFERDDTPIRLPLDYFDTENTVVRNVAEMRTSYSISESHIRGHRNSLRKRTARKAAHAYAPQSDGTFTPVIATTGADRGDGHKRLTTADILTLKRRYDQAEIDMDGRYLVLDPLHLEDLILEDLKAFKDIADFVEGKPKRFAGFNILSTTICPTYDNSTMTKKAFGAASGANDAEASFAFHRDEVMKAEGTIQMFQRLEDPEQRGDIMGFQMHFIGLPIRSKGIGAIVGVEA